jgi:acyl carrier protein phosphodiesterase
VNYLAHFLLAQNKPHLEVGGFMGDYVKGQLVGRFPKELEDGIRLHRKIDAFTDNHACVKQSCHRIDSTMRRYAPIMVDIFFDHLLAKHWHQYHSETLSHFSDRIFSNMQDYQEVLPDKVWQIAMRMKQFNVLSSYADPSFLSPVLTNLSQRLKRKNPVAEGYQQFQDNMEGLTKDFEIFFPEAINFAKQTSRSFDRN